MPGWKSKLRASLRKPVAKPRQGHVFESRTVAAHLYDWAIGKSSAVTLRRHCRNSVRDDQNRDIVSTGALLILSGIGGIGNRKKNTSRALRTSLKRIGMDVSHFVIAVPQGGSVPILYTTSHTYALSIYRISRAAYTVFGYKY